jgi:hypothetical protein
MRNTASATTPRLLLAAASLLLCAAAAAQQSPTLYRWVDKDGHVHYGDSAQAPNAKPINPRLLNSGEDSSAGADDEKAAAARQAECKSKADDYNRFKNAASFTETDALGNSRTYTQQEKDLLVERKRQALVDKCGAAAAAPAAPQT